MYLHRYTYIYIYTIYFFKYIYLNSFIRSDPILSKFSTALFSAPHRQGHLHLTGGFFSDIVFSLGDLGVGVGYMKIMSIYINICIYIINVCTCISKIGVYIYIYLLMTSLERCEM